MRLSLPKAPGDYDARDQALMRGALERADARNLKVDSAVQFILLQRPDGTVGRLTVDNSNALHFAPL